MRHALFQATYAGTPKQFREAYCFFYLLRPGRFLLYSLLAAAIVLNFTLFAQTGSVMTAVVGGACAAMLVLNYLSVRQMAAVALRRQEKLCAGDRRVTYSVYDDCLALSSGGQERAHISIEDLRRGYQTKNLIVLYSKARQLYILPLDSFEKGSPEGLRRFLNERDVRFL